MNHWQLRQAVHIIGNGGVIAYPTEAVYGLGCRPEDLDAVSRILKMKGRAIEKGLILVAANNKQLEPYVNYPDQRTKDRVQNSWPGPVTWLLPTTTAVPPWISGSHTTVAVRVSNHPIVRDLCLKAGVLVSTSANPENHQPARSPLRVMNYFDGWIDYIVHGKVGSQSRPTEIRDAKTDKVLRLGDEDALDTN